MTQFANVSEAQLVDVVTDARGVVTISLQRPDKGNALTLAMSTALRKACGDLGQARLLVLRGLGRHFCSGMDISAGGDESAVQQVYDCLALLSTASCPVIAAVQGGAIGAGLALAACADVVLAAESTFFCLPETQLGFVPDHFLPYAEALLGKRLLRRYALSSERLSARSAIAAGVPIDVFSSDVERDAALDQCIDTFMRAAPCAVRATKTALLALPDDPMGVSQSDHEREVREGIAAFRERRAPPWYRAKADRSS